MEIERLQEEQRQRERERETEEEALLRETQRLKTDEERAIVQKEETIAPP